MGYCYGGNCCCGRCKGPYSPQPYSVLVFLALALTLLGLSSLIKFEVAIEAEQQFLTLVLLITTLLLLFLVRWLSSGDSCRQKYYCGCWKCSPYKTCY